MIAFLACGSSETEIGGFRTKCGHQVNHSRTNCRSVAFPIYFQRHGAVHPLKSDLMENAIFHILTPRKRIGTINDALKNSSIFHHSHVIGDKCIKWVLERIKLHTNTGGNATHSHTSPMTTKAHGSIVLNHKPDTISSTTIPSSQVQGCRNSKGIDKDQRFGGPHGAHLLLFIGSQGEAGTCGSFYGSGWDTITKAAKVRRVQEIVEIKRDRGNRSHKGGRKSKSCKELHRLRLCSWLFCVLSVRWVCYHFRHPIC